MLGLGAAVVNLWLAKIAIRSNLPISGSIQFDKFGALGLSQIACADADVRGSIEIGREGVYLAGMPAARRPLACEERAGSLFGVRSTYFYPI
jgi:hypothetical protein